MSDDICVVGIDMIPFGRFPDRPLAALGADAVRLALKDADLGIQDMQALYCGNLLQAHRMIGQCVLAEVGLTGIPVVNVANACATGATAFREAVNAIRAGLYEVVLALGVEQMGKGLLGSATGHNGFVEEGAIGSATMPAMFAHIGVEHALNYGTTFEQFASVAVKNHWHSTMNPKAMSRRETPLEEVMAADMIAWPNTKLMCSINVDGAAAAILMTEAEARRRGLLARAVRVCASEMTTGAYHEDSFAIPDFNRVTCDCASAALASSGMGIEQIDLIELHDCFATAEIVHYENLGLCEAGGAGRLIDSGATQLGGVIPVNVSGGLLSKGHPLGATGIANIYEVSTHLRGEAGARQVEGARVGLTHVVGGAPGRGSVCVVHVLEKI